MLRIDFLAVSCFVFSTPASTLKPISIRTCWVTAARTWVFNVSLSPLVAFSTTTVNR